ncbi:MULTISPECIES: hypothetical protein [Streptomyces]|uniref:hypothetical protein n=1 Tax=Streptomyces TaxID=1883 RepID=UPI0015C47DD4|nr:MULTISPECIES: hypothetical protein [Streptomyces]MDW4899742.1 hypothetical protein [Streptomyces californicus]QLG34657.1 hypothetical protein HXS80_25630 [Streptomyces sp. CB04723]
MLEARPVTLPARLAPGTISAALTGAEIRTPAPRAERRRPTRSLPAPDRRIPVKSRNLPRRAGY